MVSDIPEKPLDCHRYFHKITQSSSAFHKNHQMDNNISAKSLNHHQPFPKNWSIALDISQKTFIRHQLVAKSFNHPHLFSKACNNPQLLTKII